jgi:glycine/D-amino acid oxidase-like deaminating enzyme
VDIVIVGAGIVGAACAAECARAGLKTLVLDRGPIGGGTTSAGMGHIVVMDDSEPLLALTSYSRRLWQELAGSLPPEAEYNPCGTLWVAENEREMEEVRRKHRACHARGLAAQILDGAELAGLEPCLRPGLAGGLLAPEDAVVDAPAAAKFLMDIARASGAQLLAPAPVRQLLPEGGVLLEDGTRITAARAVNAAGPWSPALTPGLPVRKRKGHLVITSERPGLVRHQVVELGYLASAGAAADSVACNLQPRLNGQLIIGSSRQFDTEDAAVEPAVIERMMRRAIEFVPALGGLAGQPARAGHRAASPDRLPLIGPVAGNDHIWAATGHEGLGITTAPATGRLLAAMLLGRPAEIPTAPYHPGRFG